MIMNIHGIKKAIGEFNRSWEGYGPHIYLNCRTGEVFMAESGGKDMWLLFDDKDITWIDFESLGYMFGNNKMAAVKAMCEMKMNEYENLKGSNL